MTVLPVGCLLIAARCAGRCPDTLICGRGCDPGFTCWGPAAFCAAAAVVFRMSAASRVEKARARRQRPRRRPLKLTGNTSRPGGDKRPVTAILADEVRFRPYADRTNNRTRLARTPRPTRSRVTTAGGRSPGSRVAAFGRLPRIRSQWHSRPKARRLQLRGQPRIGRASCARTAFPFDPLREPPLVNWTEPGNRSSAETASLYAAVRWLLMAHDVSERSPGESPKLRS